ncbi:MAG TPA: glycosyltransferase, partial [Armatimonadota bacterium]|nr:glycosyltransferase [Armatimonadota bacterium]
MPSPIRVAQVVEAVEGGCKKHVLDLLCGLDCTRFEQTLIYSPHRDPEFDQTVRAATQNRVETIQCDFRRTALPHSALAVYRFLGKLFTTRRFDVLNFHSAKAGFLGRMAARNLHKGARIYTPHCFPFEMSDRPFRQAPYIWLERWAGKHTDRLVAVAPSEAKLSADWHVLPQDRVVTIENGIDPTPFLAESDTAAKRAELRIEPAQPVVLSVGALRPQKGYEFLVRAAPAVLRHHPDARFLIAGEGPLRGELERLAGRLGAAESVQLLGARDDVPELLKIADCYAMPSRWEGGPYALLEAMAAGAPAVGHDIPGISDWVC